MTNKARVIACLNHRQPDKIPYHIEFTQKAHQKMIEFTGDPNFEAQLNNCMLVLSTESESAWHEVAPDIWQDEFGVRWNRAIDKDIGVVCNQLITPENINAFRFPDPADSLRYQKFEKALAQPVDQFVIANIGFSLFERAWTLAGMENILMAMMVNPGFVHDLLDRILAYNLVVIENSCRFAIDAMMFGDDWGQQTGLLMGPKLWREFIKPRITKMYQFVKSRGKFVFIHSCGKVNEIFPDLIDAGLDAFNPFQPEVMDVFAIKRRYGNSLTFYGGISTQQTLPFATVKQVQAAVERLLAEVGHKGGYIAAPAHAIPGDAKPENIIAMIETLEAQ